MRIVRRWFPWIAAGVIEIALGAIVWIVILGF
jgi:hypothetical protein